jgi:phosphoserine phosphatase
VDGKITGNLMGNNCNGGEKVIRIKQLYDTQQYDEIYCFGDTGGDKPMLALATQSFYKPFRK